MRRRVGDEIEFLWKRVSTSNWESECEEKDERKREEGDETRRDASELTDQPTDRSSPPPRLPTAPFSLTFNLSSNLQAQTQSHQLQNQPKKVSSVLRFSPFRAKDKGKSLDFQSSKGRPLLLTTLFLSPPNSIFHTFKPTYTHLQSAHPGGALDSYPSKPQTNPSGSTTFNLSLPRMRHPFPLSSLFFLSVFVSLTLLTELTAGESLVSSREGGRGEWSGKRRR